MGYKKNDKCIQKAFDDERLFVLMTRDATSPRIVMEWIKENLDKQPEYKLREAFECALEMQRRGPDIRDRKMFDGSTQNPYAMDEVGLTQQEPSARLPIVLVEIQQVNRGFDLDFQGLIKDLRLNKIPFEVVSTANGVEHNFFETFPSIKYHITDDVSTNGFFQFIEIGSSLKGSGTSDYLISHILEAQNPRDTLQG